MKRLSPLSKRTVSLLTVLCLGLLLLFIKVSLFRALSYRGDIFLHLQIARGPFDGRPIFFDNFYAPGSYIHSYFILILIGPLVAIWGAYGLFAIHVLCHIAAAATTTLAVLRSSGSALLGLTFAVTVLFGPIALWLFDDPVYGWHSELLFFPLGMLFLCGLHAHSPWRYLWGGLLVLNREDGAVLACCLHLLWFLANEIEPKGGSAPLRRFLLRATVIVFYWVCVFGVSLLILKLFGDPALVRQDKALRYFFKIAHEQHLQEAALAALSGTAALVLSLLPFALTGISWRPLVAACLVALPMLFVNLLASCAYLPKVPSFLSHGPTWPARFAMLWAIVAGGVLLALLRGGEPQVRSHSFHSRFLLAGLLSLIVQIYALIEVRDYDVHERLTLAFESGARWRLTELRVRERRFIRCISDSLPPRTPLLIPNPLDALFHQHDLVSCENIANAWQPPELIMRFGELACSEAGDLSPNFAEGRLGRFAYRFNPSNGELQEALQGCRQRARS